MFSICPIVFSAFFVCPWLGFLPLWLFPSAFFVYLVVFSVLGIRVFCIYVCMIVISVIFVCRFVFPVSWFIFSWVFSSFLSLGRVWFRAFCLFDCLFSELCSCHYRILFPVSLSPCQENVIQSLVETRASFAAKFHGLHAPPVTSIVPQQAW